MEVNSVDFYWKLGLDRVEFIGRLCGLVDFVNFTEIGA
jgi:hypothetical protein